MKIYDFPYPKLNLPLELRELEKDPNREIFQPTTDYIHLISDYIYTDINLEQEGSLRMHAWIMKVISANLIRSLYIRNSFVDGVNSRNIYSMNFSLKAMFEVVGVLASILDLIDKNYPADEFMEKFEPYALGNKGKGEFRVGEVEAKSVATMIEKADKYFTKLSKEMNRDKVVDNYFISFYDNASSATHPCFDSYEYIGGLKEKSWHVFTPEEFKENISRYSPHYGGLMLSPICIYQICKEIFAKCGDGFKEVNAVKFFD